MLASDGWLRTGDVGQWNIDGSLTIVDRKKNIFKLAQGEYIAVESVEGVVAKSKYVMQCWVYGNSFENALVAVIVPDKDAVLGLCRRKVQKKKFSTTKKSFIVALYSKYTRALTFENFFVCLKNIATSDLAAACLEKR